MIWDGWQAFWAMGGHAPFVWGAYVVTALVLVAEIAAVAGRLRRAARARRRQDGPA